MLKKKLFLTSALCMAFACPAFAVDGNDLIENGDTCNNTNLGTYEGTANVEAIWTIDPRTCTAGQSYDASTNTCITCTAGNYCPGGTFNVNSQTNGLNTCPSGYALSESGAGADTDCYRQCATTDVAHSTGVSGGYYYGDNNQCEPTSCASGWHLKEGFNLSDEFAKAQSNITNSSIGYVKYPDEYNNYTATYYGDNNQPASYYGITGDIANTWGVNIGGFGIVYGEALCSTQSGTNNGSAWTNPTTFASLTDETGQAESKYCYCKITGYIPSGETEQIVSSSWVYYNTIGGSTADHCKGGCVNACANNILVNQSFRNFLFNSSVGGLSTCEANNIALKWYNDNTEVVPVNSAAEQCTYNETITIPTNEPSKTGYTFGGWKLRTTTQEP